MQPNDQNIQIQKIINQNWCAQSKRLILCAKDINSDDQSRHWKQLLRYRNWQQINNLNLCCCSITSSDVQVMIDLKWPNLEKFDLDSNYIGDIGVNKIWGNQWLKLKQIRLCRNQISQVGLRGLLTSSINKLNSISLSQNSIGSKGAELLSKADMPALKSLQAFDCQLNSAGVKKLSKANWPLLEECYIQQNNVGYDGLLVLINFNTNKLRQLRIGQYIINLGVIYIVAMNAEQTVNSTYFVHLNRSLERDVNEILKMKVEFFQR